MTNETHQSNATSVIQPIDTTTKIGKTTKHPYGAIPEFVKKLFRMLEENAFPSVLRWGTNGTTFVVVDPNEFSKLILPQHFKHSNFASFVRQLNKYDFHKIRHKNDSHLYGKQAWKFQHSHFQYQRKDLLYGIKRKSTNKPTQRSSLIQSVSKRQQKQSSSASNNSMDKMSLDIKVLVQQLTELQESQPTLSNRLRSLAGNHQLMVETLSTIQTTIKAQDDFIRKLLAGPSSLLCGHNKDNVNNITTSSITTTTTTEKESTHGLLESSFDITSKKQQAKLAQMTQWVEKQQQQQHFSSPTNHSGQGPLPVPPIIVPPTLSVLGNPSIPSGLPTNTIINTTAPISNFMCATTDPSLPDFQWSVVPRILLAINENNTTHNSKDHPLTQWLHSFGCIVELVTLNQLVHSMNSGTRYDLLFVNETLLSQNMTLLDLLRQKDPWVPLICLCQVISDQVLSEWVKHGVTDILLANPFNPMTLYPLVDKYCSHMKANSM
ncbi:HSF-type DNA-binding-domain-containing protein [Halteromyces radiatus]|uniref:HSF-type DNA-binding-domain-containing protein n=1 Tax=Halteromyces radiatus TaxID=101107 RepID=UPI002220D195|nr:HSF-type DNA-binding-domain-containing protein [Halteromyces radiatus]KAI8088682.1 HSF-type DNA-binding-domain-containing protein [Halteromyces radiatus]